MKPLVLPLLLLIAGCSGGLAPRYGQQQDAVDDTITAGCRQDAERMMRYRERGQLMRVDEAQSRLGTGADIGNPLERNQLGARFEQDRLVAECLRSATPASPAVPATPQITPAPGGGGRAR
jgi:hypothetical protein